MFIYVVLLVFISKQGDVDAVAPVAIADSITHCQDKAQKALDNDLADRAADMVKQGYSIRVLCADSRQGFDVEERDTGLDIVPEVKPNI